jgi:hypothetical protein
MNVLQCSRPILLDNDDPEISNLEGIDLLEEFAYSTTGTAFICRFGARHYVLAAWHVVGPAGPERVLILPTDHERTTLAFDKFTSGEGQHSDHYDFAVFRVARESDPVLADKPYVLSLTRQITVASGLASGAPLIVSGYPGERRSAAAFAIRHQRHNLGARYLKPDPNRQYLHALQIVDRAGLETFQSMSGSPVFLWSTPETVSLVGMLIEAGNSGKGHFIDCIPLVNAVRLADR